MPHLSLLFRLADHRRADSLAARLRARRFAAFRAWLETLFPVTEESSARPLRLLDLGGTVAYWLGADLPLDPARLRITLLNRRAVAIPQSCAGVLSSVAGDATDLSAWPDGSVDVVFSNSVIEHVGSFAAQTKMAREIARVGRAYWVQTPYRYFPIEPHALIPLYQFMPLRLRLLLAVRWRVGWYARMAQADLPHLAEEVRDTRLLSARQMRQLFPAAQLLRERVAGLTKSLTAVWPAAPAKPTQRARKTRRRHDEA